MLIFLDTEFTGLDQPWPHLISIGLVSDNGLHSFYAELPEETYRDLASPWVRVNVLPLLEGDDCVMSHQELCRELITWIELLGNIQIAVDSGIDFDFLRSILNPWPANLARDPIYMAGGDFTDAVEDVYASNRDLRRHHALDDAKANAMGFRNAHSMDWP